jgi:hypothetical protein
LKKASAPPILTPDRQRMKIDPITGPVSTLPVGSPGRPAPINVGSRPTPVERPLPPLTSMGYNPLPPLPSYKAGTDRVPKTGPAILHKDEAVLNKHDADNYREGKGTSMDGVLHNLGGEEHKPKEISHMTVRKSKNGGHIFEHHHKSGHAMEEHTTHGTDHAVSHFMQHMTDQNPGEAAADAGDSTTPSGAPMGLPAGAGPSPAATPIPGV